jgi:hypothetical protein
MTQLCELVDEYQGALEADFAQFYSGLDLADVWRGALTKRRALELAEQLAFEPRSRYRAQALGGAEFIGHDKVAILLSDLYDALNGNTVVTAKAAGGKPKTPDPYPRPEVKKPAESGGVNTTVDVPTIDEFPIHLVIGMTGGRA